MPVSTPQKSLGLPPAFLLVKTGVWLEPQFAIVKYFDGGDEAPDSFN